jgi:uncharacterized protein (DUF983 family)
MLKMIGLKHYTVPLWQGVIWNLVVIMFSVMQYHLIKKVLVCVDLTNSAKDCEGKGFQKVNLQYCRWRCVTAIF